jgi:hypothetical protein
MTDYQVTYIVRGVETTSYVKAATDTAAIQIILTMFPDEIITVGQVLADVIVPDHEKVLPTPPPTIIVPDTTHYPNGDIPA